jgi:hypothetical protein
LGTGESQSLGRVKADGLLQQAEEETTMTEQDKDAKVYSAKDMAEACKMGYRMAQEAASATLLDLADISQGHDNAIGSPNLHRNERDALRSSAKEISDLAGPWDDDFIIPANGPIKPIEGFMDLLPENWGGTNTRPNFMEMVVPDKPAGKRHISAGRINPRRQPPSNPGNAAEAMARAPDIMEV